VKTEGIGYIGDKTLGVNIHSCLAVSADGLVLGSLDQSDYNRAEGEKLTVNYFCIEIKTVETGKVVYKNRRDNGQNGYQREC
jgi:hypothetical protein